jgi:acetyltransferase-like isoleucine patch superfamily enzyme
MKGEIGEFVHVYPKVEIGAGHRIEMFCVIGKPMGGQDAEGEKTVIGAGATIRSHTVIYEGNRIGDHFQTGHHVLVREQNRIGHHVSIGTKSVVEYHVVIGDHVRLHTGVFVPEYSVLEDGCWLGPNVTVTNVFHPLCPKAKTCVTGATIKKNARIGANATLLPDITVGENALVGSGSVVVKDVPPNTVVAGVPARVVKEIKDLSCPYGLIDHPYLEEGYIKGGAAARRKLKKMSRR